MAVAPDPGAPGEPCTVRDSPTSGLDDCEHGAVCFHVDPRTLEGTCVSYCDGTPEFPTCPLATQTCAQTNNGASTLCLTQCDPLAETCPGKMGCYAVNDAFACMTPRPDASLQPGQPCSDEFPAFDIEAITNCAPGMLCIGAPAFSTCDGGSCCAPLCDFMDPQTDELCAGLDPVQACEPWFVEGFAPTGYENVGVCAQPQ